MNVIVNCKNVMIFLLLGAQGVLWCGPREVLGKDADTIVDENVACKLFAAHPMDVNEIVHTNGAGDAFCGGMLAMLLGMSGGNGPTMECIQSGLLAAKQHMTVKK